MTRQGLIDAVIDDLVGQVVGPAGLGIHTGTAADGVESGEDFDVGCAVVWSHAFRATCGALIITATA
jgi:hypothetical protein